MYTRSTPTNIRKHGVCKRKSNSLEKRIPQHVLTDNKKPIYDNCTPILDFQEAKIIIWPACPAGPGCPAAADNSMAFWRA